MFFERWDFMLGLKWTEEDLEQLVVGMSKKPSDQTSIEDLESQTPTQEKGVLRFPLSLLVRPELVETLKERALPSQGGFKGMSHVPSDALSLSDVRKDEFLRKMGVLPASDRDLSGRDKDSSSMFNTSSKPASGFKEGPMRSLGGRK